jgi:intracellular sulfur oxidation DsrE/DsrF family protein
MHKKIACILLLLLSSSAHADSAQEVDALIARNEAPPGVVFEVAQKSETALELAVPRVKQYAERLRARFPQLKIALVTHGREEFALLKDKAEQYKPIQSSVRELVKNQDIAVHVCGTHASWFDKHPEDFPDYIDVAPSGPAQIRNYRELGFVLVVLRPAQD